MISHTHLDLHNQLQKLQLVPVITLPSVKAGLLLAEILLKCQLPVAEITFRTACAGEAMTVLKKEYPELLLLAGTVLNFAQVDEAMAAGAAAIVSPGFTAQLAEYCREKKIPFYPGVCTPSEVQMAVEAGLTTLKFFPAELSGGIKMLSLFRSIYKDISFMPTGGISQDTVINYLALDNVTCCGGTWLSPEHLMIEEKWDEIERRVTTSVKTIADSCKIS